MRKTRYTAILAAVGVLLLGSLACSSGPIGAFFATATPTPTSTPTSTPTPTATPTATPTDTPTPTPTPLPTGVATEEQPDGTTLFTDYDNNYQLVLSSDWIVVPLRAEDLADMVAELAEEHPELADQAEALQQLDADIFRMTAMNKDPNLFSSGYASNVSVAAFEDPTLTSMPLAFISAVMEDTLESQGATILTTGVNEIENANGVEVEYLDFEQSVPTPTGATVRVRGRVIMFLTDDKLVMITVGAPKDVSDEILAQANEIGQSIKLLK